MYVTFPLVMFCMILNTAAQILLKKGMNQIGHFAFTLQNFLPVFIKIIFSPFVFFGLTCYVMSFAVWLLVLSRMDVAIAYPLTSIAFVMTAIAAAFMFGEPLTAIRVTGIFIIIFGVFLLFRS